MNQNIICSAYKIENDECVILDFTVFIPYLTKSVKVLNERLNTKLNNNLIQKANNLMIEKYIAEDTHHKEIILTSLLENTNKLIDIIGQLSYDINKAIFENNFSLLINPNFINSLPLQKVELNGSSILYDGLFSPYLDSDIEKIKSSMINRLTLQNIDKVNDFYITNLLLDFLFHYKAEKKPSHNILDINYSCNYVTSAEGKSNCTSTEACSALSYSLG